MHRPIKVLLSHMTDFSSGDVDALTRLSARLLAQFGLWVDDADHGHINDEDPPSMGIRAWSMGNARKAQALR